MTSWNPPMLRERFQSQLLELIRRTSAFLPHDVGEVLETHQALEQSGSRADLALRLVATNIALAKQQSAPICQDTGTITFYIRTPVGFDQLELQDAACDAVREATKLGYLRQNSVDSITGKNSGTNLGPGSPVFHWHQHRKDVIDIRLILKGGGCENMSAQYSLPCNLPSGGRADRDLDGVYRCVMDAVWQAQGKGCGPGFLGVCIGGDRATGYEYAKELLLREVDDANSDPQLAELEQKILETANSLDIGPMGFGGKLTVGSCKVGHRNRLPASYFVTIAYMCWAYRRRGVVLDQNAEVVDWTYQTPGEFDHAPDAGLIDLGLPQGTKIVKLQTPLQEADVRQLKAGDVVMLSGTVFTGRDAVHKYIDKGGDVPVLKNAVLYHCGPVVMEENGKYRVTAAGPTTSIREEPYQAGVIAKYGIKAVIGKGGMGAKTLVACKDFGCVYLHAIGGAAQVYARCVKSTPHVYFKEEFGSPEAVWEMHVEDFPAVVTMDSHGRSLHQEVQTESQERLKETVKA